MSASLDLSDVAATSPLAARELAQLSEKLGELNALLRDCRRQIRATLWLLESEVAEIPQDLPASLVGKGRAILGRIDAVTETDAIQMEGRT